MKITYADGVEITVKNGDVEHNPVQSEVHVFVQGEVIVFPIFEGTEVEP